MQAEPTQGRAAEWGPPDRALSFWYRPWLYTHPSWLQTSDRAWLAGRQSDELMQRVLYPSWCGIFSLPPHPTDYDDSIWWKIASVTCDVFERANYLVGLVLVFARNRRNGFALTNSPAASNGGDLRGVLHNACFVPKAVLDLEGWEGVVEPEISGFLSLHFAVGHAAPCLARRIALRYRYEHAQRGSAVVIRAAGEGDVERSVRFMGRLWQGAIARCSSDGDASDFIGADVFFGTAMEAGNE